MDIAWKDVHLVGLAKHALANAVNNVMEPYATETMVLVSLAVLMVILDLGVCKP